MSKCVDHSLQAVLKLSHECCKAQGMLKAAKYLGSMLSHAHHASVYFQDDLKVRREHSTASLHGTFYFQQTPHVRKKRARR